MATAGVFSDEIAKITGLSRSSVLDIVRHLRSAGMVSNRGRGRNATDIGVSDAARVLIAVGAADRAFDAPEIVNAFSRARHDDGSLLLQDLESAIEKGTVAEVSVTIPCAQASIGRRQYACKKPWLADVEPDSVRDRRQFVSVGLMKQTRTFAGELVQVLHDLTRQTSGSAQIPKFDVVLETLLSEGNSPREIAKQTGKSRQHVYQRMKVLGFTRSTDYVRSD